MRQTRHIDVSETPRIPLLSLAFGYGPMLPFVVGPLVVGLASPPWQIPAADATLLWGAAILAFLAGVRRGLSFRTEGGPALAQIVTMFCLFVLALGALVSLWLEARPSSAGFLLLGFGTILVTDPLAARHGQAPLFFARLRPPQMAIAVVGIAALAATILHFGL